MFSCVWNTAASPQNLSELQVRRVKQHSEPRLSRMVEDTYEHKASVIRNEIHTPSNVPSKLPNPWLDNPKPVSNQYPGIRFRMKEFHNRSRIMHAKGTKWPYRLHPDDQAKILFFEFRGYGQPPNDIGHPGDFYLDLTPSPGPHYLLYTCGLGHWTCVNWSNDPHLAIFEVRKHPLLKDRLLSGNRTSGFTWVTQDTMNRRHSYSDSRRIDMDIMTWEALESDAQDGALYVELTGDSLQRKCAEDRRRKKEWDAWLEVNPCPTAERAAKALARSSLKDLICQRQKEGLYKQTDDAMLHGPSTHCGSTLSVAPSPTATMETQGLSSTSTQKRKRSFTPPHNEVSSHPVSKHHRCSESSCSASGVGDINDLVAVKKRSEGEETEHTASKDGQSARHKQQSECTGGFSITPNVTRHSTSSTSQHQSHPDMTHTPITDVSSDAAQNALDVVGMYIIQHTRLQQERDHLKVRVEELCAASQEERENTAQFHAVLVDKDEKIQEAARTIAEVKGQLDENVKLLQDMKAERDKALSDKLQSEAMHAAKISQAEELFLKGQQFLASLKPG